MASASAPSCTATKAEDVPWHANLPAPKSTAASISRQDLLTWFSEKTVGKDFVLVDLRRTDYEGGTIHGSINLPAQSLYHTIPSLYAIFSAANIRHVIWYCGSSRGRGTRASGWFEDYIKERGDSQMKSLTLEGGIKGWATAGKEYVELMDDYHEEVWK
ncbi:hypothetical protein M430DRAFT_134786 [Amorphotheca resinae ATCC 22711]|uniref:Rhodanese domain-containing protein n=1 Tax=Amorphotheca resinae ATCC 22711 TaxID=857342 RepID=A0A2T3BCA6_AMORE|nr:hypothetical protein M430DRAFT_134786 [Amorphotheca resinae ATCC 22711]PSS25899.1 hypothetical protein M430DRAFT_134786 [Amorphotheca resinae ATCC 22711]